MSHYYSIHNLLEMSLRDKKLKLEKLTELKSAREGVKRVLKV